MKFSLAIIATAFAAGVAAHDKGQPHGGGNATVTTEIVTAYTTYCPGPTTLTHGGSTYTVTEATTLTITPSNCPCTKTSTIPVSPVSPTTYTSVAPIPVTTPVATSTHSTAPYANSTITKVTSAAVGTGSTTASTTIKPFTGAAGRTVAGAGLAGLVAVAVMAF